MAAGAPVRAGQVGDRWLGNSIRVAFTNAWRNKLMLAEAVLFTGLFWLLLFLWQALFHLLGIDYFRNLFEEPIFIYPPLGLSTSRAP